MIDGSQRPLFFVGLHRPSVANRFDRCCISINVLMGRKSSFPVNDWIMDSGAFTCVTRYGDHVLTPEGYAEEINRFAKGKAASGNLLAAVAQDYMCESIALEKTGKTIPDHQRMTIDRYDALMAAKPAAYIMPVLQGYSPDDYRRHVDEYGDRLAPGQWTGVGSVCKRNGSPTQIEDVLLAINDRRPDLPLHGFGVKFSSLRSPIVSRLLHSADSMAWSASARFRGRPKDANCPDEAMRYCRKIAEIEQQTLLFI